MKALFAILALVLVLATSPAFAFPRPEALVEKAVRDGEVYDATDFITYSFSHGNVADRTQPRQVDYVSVTGRPGATFQPFLISLVAEDWQQPQPGVWTIDQWIRGFGLDGTLTQLLHAKITESADGQVLDYQSLPTGGAQDPGERERADALMAVWYQRLGL